MPHIANRWSLSCHVSCEVCAKELTGDFVDDILDRVADARTGGIAARLQEAMDEGEAVKVSIGAADPIEIAQPQGSAHRAPQGKGTAKKSRHQAKRLRSAPMRALGDRSRARSTRAVRESGDSSTTRNEFGTWKRNTKVKLWMKDDAEWVDGKIVKYVTPTERMDRVRQQNDGLVGKMPKFKRGMYLVRWQVKGDSKRFDEDYVSDGDATLEEA